jgi:hypothetical protein
MTKELSEVLDEVELYLDGRADAEGDGTLISPWVPNKAMHLLNQLRDARMRADAKAE